MAELYFRVYAKTPLMYNIRGFGVHPKVKFRRPSRSFNMFIVISLGKQQLAPLYGLKQGSI